MTALFLVAIALVVLALAFESFRRLGGRAILTMALGWIAIILVAVWLVQMFG